jgi:hypothetical protein
MPGLVHASGLDEAAYPLDQLAMEITRRVQHSREPNAHFAHKSYAAEERPSK